MSFVNVDGVRIYYRLDSGFDRNDPRPVLVMSHSLGLDHGQWDPQVADFRKYFRVLRYDLRGHGASDTPPGDYTMELLGRDVLAIVDALGIEKFAFCGLSIGGMIGQWVAANAPDRVTHLVLANTVAKYSDPGPIRARCAEVRKSGVGAVEELVMGRFFLPESLSGNPPHVSWARQTLLSTNSVGYAGCCSAVAALDHLDLLSKICCPTLIIHGERDQATLWSGGGEVLAASINGAKVVHLPTAHISNLERPRSFSAALFDFLSPSDKSMKAGMAVRREVLGNEWVDRVFATATDFTREFQEFITRYAWGGVWARPGLDYRTRRLIALGIIAALGRWEEYKAHVTLGLKQDLEPCDLNELLLETAIYAGVPAAYTGFRIANELINQPVPGNSQ